VPRRSGIRDTPFRCRQRVDPSRVAEQFTWRFFVPGLDPLDQIVSAAKSHQAINEDLMEKGWPHSGGIGIAFGARSNLRSHPLGTTLP
jgi:hypothetical protein